MKKTDQSMDIMRTMKDIMSHIRHHTKIAFKDMGITAPQGYLLGLISRNGKMKVHELGEKLGMTDSTVSGIVDRLEKTGMVKRTRSKDDKRVVYVEITGKMKTVHGNFHRVTEDILGKVLGKGTPDELAAITKGLEIMKKLLGDDVPEDKKKA